MFEIFSIQLSYSFSSLFAFCFCFRLVVCHISFVFKCITLFPAKKKPFDRANFLRFGSSFLPLLLPLAKTNDFVTLHIAKPIHWPLSHCCCHWKSPGQKTETKCPSGTMAIIAFRLAEFGGSRKARAPPIPLRIPINHEHCCLDFQLN